MLNYFILLLWLCLVLIDAKPLPLLEDPLDPSCSSTEMSRNYTFTSIGVTS